MTYQESKDLERRILQTPFGVIQKAINRGQWNDRTKFNAMRFYISVGACMFGERHFFTDRGLYIPSRYKCKAGSIGSPQYVKMWFPVLLAEMENELMILN